MKNPLRKRFLRELCADPGKYLVIFLLMILSIGEISGFLVCDESMIGASGMIYLEERNDVK